VPDHISSKMPVAKRSLLFSVAGAEFAASGFGQASLNRIIATVGMSKSSFYHYFRNKADLFEQTLNCSLAPLQTAFAAIDLDALTAETFWPEILRMADFTTEHANTQPQLVIVGHMFYRSFDNPEERVLVTRVMSGFTEWLAQLVKRGQVLHLIRDDLPAVFLIDMLVAMGMVADRWILTQWEAQSDGDRLAFNARLLDLFLRVLSPTSKT